MSYNTDYPLKRIAATLAVTLAIVIAAAACAAFLHSNSVQNFQVIQSITGTVEVRSDGGYYFRAFPKIWTYPKVNTVFFSNEAAESRDQDGVQVRFSNKGEGDVSCQVVYRLYTDAETIKRMQEENYRKMTRVIARISEKNDSSVCVAQISRNSNGTGWDGKNREDLLKELSARGWIVILSKNGQKLESVEKGCIIRLNEKGIPPGIL